MQVKLITKEVFNGTLKVCSEVGGEALFESCFDSVTVTERNKIINKEAKVKRWFAINDGSREDAMGIGARKEAKGSKGLSAGVVPVPRTAFEAIEGLFE